MGISEGGWQVGKERGWHSSGEKQCKSTEVMCRICPGNREQVCSAGAKSMAGAMAQEAKKRISACKALRGLQSLSGPYLTRSSVQAYEVQSHCY